MQRSVTERVVQSLAFEAGGLVLAVPLYQAIFGHFGTEGLILLVAMSVAVVMWNPLHDHFFDAVEHWLTRRAASARPYRIRLVHAISHEVTPVAITLPLSMGLAGHGLAEALTLNVGLTLVYVVYTYVFYLAYDRILPLKVPALA